MVRDVFLLAIFLLGAALPVGGRSLVIESFDVQVRIGQDGTFEISETIRPGVTRSWDGIFRNIRLEHRDGHDAPSGKTASEGFLAVNRVWSGGS